MDTLHFNEFARCDFFFTIFLWITRDVFVCWAPKELVASKWKSSPIAKAPRHSLCHNIESIFGSTLSETLRRNGKCLPAPQRTFN